MPIWKTLLGDAPIPGREALDFSSVAERFPFSGGRIRNAFMDSCQRAAEAGAISQDILLAACEEEQRSSIATQRGVEKERKTMKAGIKVWEALPSTSVRSLPGPLPA